MILRPTELKLMPYGFGACVYAAEMDNGIVKIGFSQNPRSRIGALSSEAIRVFKTRLDKFYVSPLLTKREGRNVEAIALSVARPVFSTHHKMREFFYELPFNEAVLLLEDSIRLEAELQNRTKK